ncbi:unnamed protein product [Vitrella brassicaformis CCMP3155]|uniref:Uncharacterized protein n=2 Tax=Vitrella brassicaformis TaxID=1169539 RepID=A0A0G4ET55_VITBC|nr:unnamed protein product [Vitrella brassicaformis CCMP3155]|mmetsp:Transcript_26116/g.64873  ORF Transcript_26116/g.64873 Transcript_26116/m.64873 type:complete len:849 (+) Transcript_26116:156-2702(+)|eukprot:CEM01018.1 unnamed protein product [Vitrella brassicaformis CCMP3155]
MDVTHAIDRLRSQVEEKDLEIAQLRSQLQPYLNYRGAYKHPGVGQALHTLLDIYPPLLYELSQDPKADVKDVQQFVDAQLNSLVAELPSNEADCASVRVPLTEQDCLPYLNIKKQLEKLQQANPSWYEKWGIGSHGGDAEGSEASAAATTTTTTAHGVLDSLHPIGEELKYSPRKEESEFLTKLWTQLLVNVLKHAEGAEASALLSPSADRIKQLCDRTGEQSAQLDGVKEPRQRETLLRDRIDVMSELLTAYSEKFHTILAQLQGDDLSRVQQAIHDVQHTTAEERKKIVSWKMQQDDLVNKYQDKIQQMQAYCQEKADKLDEAQNNYQAKKSGYEAEREECLKQLERVLSRIETIQEKEREDLLAIDTAACELTEATARVEERTEALNKIKLLHSQAVNRWCEGASCVDRIGVWSTDLCEALQKDMHRSTQTLVQELAPDGLRFDALKEAAFENLNMLINSKQRAYIETCNKLAKKYNKLQYLLNAGDPEELAAVPEEEECDMVLLPEHSPSEPAIPTTAQAASASASAAAANDSETELPASVTVGVGVGAPRRSAYAIELAKFNKYNTLEKKQKAELEALNEKKSQLEKLTTEYFRSLDYFSKHQGASPTHMGESDQTNIKLLIKQKLVQATQEGSETIDSAAARQWVNSFFYTTASLPKLPAMPGWFSSSSTSNPLPLLPMTGSMNSYMRVNSLHRPGGVDASPSQAQHWEVFTEMSETVGTSDVDGYQALDNKETLEALANARVLPPRPPSPPPFVPAACGPNVEGPCVGPVVQQLAAAGAGGGQTDAAAAAAVQDEKTPPNGVDGSYLVLNEPKMLTIDQQQQQQQQGVGRKREREEEEEAV